MRNLLALVGLVVVGFAVLGWYCGWYNLSVSRGTDGKPEIKTTLDTEKVGDDASSFFRKMGKLIEEKATHGDKDGKAGPPAGSPGNTPAPSTSGGGGWFVGSANSGKNK